MVSQFRYPLQKNLLEFPAGKLEQDEDPSNCAVRELKEETGYSPGNINKIGEIIYSSDSTNINKMVDKKAVCHPD